MFLHLARLKYAGWVALLSCRRLTLSYIVIVTSSVTIRMAAGKRAKLRRRAQLAGKTESAFIREVLERELEPRPMGERIGHLKGTLSFKGVKMDDWQKAIKENNWRR